MSNEIPAQTVQLLRQVCTALDDKKAENLRVIQVSEVSSITDYLVLATGTSEPHLRALRVELEKVLDASGTRILGMDTGMESGWIVVDAFDLMIHVFTPENRERYSLENLWKDAAELSVQEIITGQKLKPVRKPAKKAKAPAAKAKKPAAKGKVKKAAPKKPAAAKPKAKAKKKG